MTGTIKTFGAFLTIAMVVFGAGGTKQPMAMEAMAAAAVVVTAAAGVMAVVTAAAVMSVLTGAAVTAVPATCVAVISVVVWPPAMSAAFVALTGAGSVRWRRRERSPRPWVWRTAPAAWPLDLE